MRVRIVPKSDTKSYEWQQQYKYIVFSLKSCFKMCPVKWKWGQRQSCWSAGRPSGTDDNTLLSQSDFIFCPPQLQPQPIMSPDKKPLLRAEKPNGLYNQWMYNMWPTCITSPPKLIPVGLNTVLEGGFFCTRMIKKEDITSFFSVSDKRFCSYWCFSFLQIWLIQSGNGYFTFGNFGSSVLAFLSPPRWEELRREEERRVRATRRQWTAPMVWCHRHYTETGHSA